MGLVSSARQVIKKSPLLARWGVTGCKLYRQCKETIWPKSVLENSAAGALTEIRVKGYRNTFAGYYDVTPFRPGDSNLLTLHCNTVSPNTRPSVRHRTDIVLYNLTDGGHQVIDSTWAWNWQQGSRLQWVDRNRVIYNKYDLTVGRVYAELCDIENGTGATLPINVNACFKDQYAVSLDYYALSCHTEYGYPGISEAARDHEIKRCSLATGRVDPLFAVDDVKNLLGRQTFEKEHINHILISPDGARFVFIYRYFHAGHRIDNLMIYSFADGAIRVVVPRQVISHCAWCDCDTLLFWGSIDATPGLYRWSVTETAPALVLPMRHDTHPAFLDDHTILGDSYPSLYTGLQSAFVLDIQTGRRQDLLKVSHPVVHERANRCDLHPSISEDGRFFQVDTRYRGDRSIVIGELNSEWRQC